MHFQGGTGLGYSWVFAVIVLSLAMAGCGSSAPPRASQSEELKVVATTTIVGDVVRNVGGEHIDISVLLPVGTDPHSFDPTPQDVAKVAQADLIFANVPVYEAFLDRMQENAGGRAEVVYISEDIQLLQAPDLHTEEADSGEEHAGGDPHTWFDPINVVQWTKTIEQKLSAIDPSNAEAYRANAQKYQAQLEQLDTWIQEQVAQVPEANRQLVTDHEAFTYFASRYGFEMVGAIIPSYSTLAQPSAQELAALEDSIRRLNVKAVFVGNSVNPTLAQRVVEDTGIQIVYLYTESLSASDGPASTYLDFMRYNVSAIVEALKET